MRVNVYAEEMTDLVEIVQKKTADGDFTGLRIYLQLPATVNGENYQGPFLHHPGDDDSSAVTFWGKKDLRGVLRKALDLLSAHYEQQAVAHDFKAGLDLPEVDVLAVVDVQKRSETPAPGRTYGIYMDLEQIWASCSVHRPASTDNHVDIAANDGARVIEMSADEFMARMRGPNPLVNTAPVLQESVEAGLMLTTKPPAYDWVSDATQMAALCWCEEATKDRVIDPELCQAFGKLLGGWMNAAAQYARNEEYWRGIVSQIAASIMDVPSLGVEIHQCDDGTLSPDPLLSKVPDAVKRLVATTAMH